MNFQLPENLLSTMCPELIEIAAKAGDIILSYADHHEGVQIKPDGSPVSKADLESDQWIRSELAALTPDIPVISEETEVPEYTVRQDWTEFWLVDPLDGTKEYLWGREEYTVNIALIHDRYPVLGLIYAPALKTLYIAKHGLGAYRLTTDGKYNRLPVEQRVSSEYRIIGSRSHAQSEIKTYVKSLKAANRKVKYIPCGSALKFARLSEGAANEFPRFITTREWDTAAGVCILWESGGDIELMETGNMPAYNTPELVSPPFVARIR